MYLYFVNEKKFNYWIINKQKYFSVAITGAEAAKVGRPGAGAAKMAPQQFFYYLAWGKRLRSTRVQVLRNFSYQTLDKYG